MITEEEILANAAEPEKEAPAEPLRAGPWSADDEDLLSALVRNGASLDDMRRALHRDPQDIENKLRVLGVPPHGGTDI